MDRRTIEELRALNRRFYEARGVEFHERRTRPWRGFARALELCRGRLGGRIRVLDVGSGNGRFAAAVGSTFPGGFDYLGLDESEALLAKARDRFGAEPHIELERADVLDPATWASLDRPFDLVAAFGLFHHVPSREARAALLGRMRDVARDGGVLALSFWRVTAIASFGSRVLPWNAAPGVDPAELEPGDHLLSFGGGDGPPRYCHEVAEEEIDALTRVPGLLEIARFREDGGLNVYSMLERRV